MVHAPALPRVLRHAVPKQVLGAHIAGNVQTLCTSNGVC